MNDTKQALTLSDEQVKAVREIIRELHRHRLRVRDRISTAWAIKRAVQAEAVEDYLVAERGEDGHGKVFADDALNSMKYCDAGEVLEEMEQQLLGDLDNVYSLERRLEREVFGQ